MKQSRATSFTKSLVSTAIGFIVALGANAMVLPLFGFSPSLSQNFAITCVYTVISVARGYLLERAFEAMGWRTRMSAFAIAVLAERERQITQEGWSAEHDDALDVGELAAAAAAYASCAGQQWAGERLMPPLGWPWPISDWKPYSFRRDMVKAGALIVAEGERHDRQRKSKRSPSAASEPELEERRVHV